MTVCCPGWIRTETS